MADKVQYVMDRMAPMFRTLLDNEVFSNTELEKIIKKRTDFEYVLRRRQLVVSDFYSYLQYEMNLDKLRELRFQRVGLDNAKEKKTIARTIQSSFTRHITYIFERAIRRFPKELSLWADFIAFLKTKNRVTDLSTVFGRVLSLFPKNEDLWLQAAVHELDVNQNAHATRVLLQRGLRIILKSKKLWLHYFEMELLYHLRIHVRKSILGLDHSSKSSSNNDGQEGVEVGNSDNDDDDDKLKNSSSLANSPPMIVLRHALNAITDPSFAFECHKASIGMSDEISDLVEQEVKKRYGYLDSFWSHLCSLRVNAALFGNDIHLLEQEIQQPKQQEQQEQLHAESGYDIKSRNSNKRKRKSGSISIDEIIKISMQALRVCVDTTHDAYMMLHMQTEQQPDLELEVIVDGDGNQADKHGTSQSFHTDHRWAITLMDSFRSALDKITDHVGDCLCGDAEEEELQCNNDAISECQVVIKDGEELLGRLSELAHLQCPSTNSSSTSTSMSHSTNDSLNAVVTSIPAVVVSCTLSVQLLRTLIAGLSSTTTSYLSDTGNALQCVIPNPKQAFGTSSTQKSKAKSKSKSALSAVLVNQWLVVRGRELLQVWESGTIGTSGRVSGSGSGRDKHVAGDEGRGGVFEWVVVAAKVLEMNRRFLAMSEKAGASSDADVVTTCKGAVLDAVHLILEHSTLAAGSPVGNEVLGRAVELALASVDARTHEPAAGPALPIAASSSKGKRKKLDASVVSMKTLGVDSSEGGEQVIYTEDVYPPSRDHHLVVVEALQKAVLSRLCPADSRGLWCLQYVKTVSALATVPQTNNTDIESDRLKAQREAVHWLKSNLISRPDLKLSVDLTMMFEFVLEMELQSLRKMSKSNSIDGSTQMKQKSGFVYILDINEWAVKECPGVDAFWTYLEEVYRLHGDHKSANHVMWRKGQIEIMN